MGGRSGQVCTCIHRYSDFNLAFALALCLLLLSACLVSDSDSRVSPAAFDDDRLSLLHRQRRTRRREETYVFRSLNSRLCVQLRLCLRLLLQTWI